MNISILTTSETHPIWPHLQKWCDSNGNAHNIKLTTDPSELVSGDFLFLISCSHYVNAQMRDKYKHTLVVHASDLPQGKGWSPHIWQILEGKNEISLTLLEAADKIDSGDIWLKHKLNFSGTELYDEINIKLFIATLELMDIALRDYQNITPQPQNPDGESFYPKRTPEDSAVDPDKTIAEQFNLLRIADPDRYPAYFEYRGERYTIEIKKDLEAKQND